MCIHNHVDVDTLPCGYIAMWIHYHVDTLPCGYITMWIHYYVDTLPCVCEYTALGIGIRVHVRLDEWPFHVDVHGIPFFILFDTDSALWPRARSKHISRLSTMGHSTKAGCFLEPYFSLRGSREKNLQRT
jgi:hypothetical protein